MSDTQDWTPIAPVPATAPPPPVRGEAYEYRTPTGELWGVVCRWDDDKGKKQVRPLVYAQNGSPDHQEWRWQGLPTPRPLYGCDLLQPGNHVLVVEGERKCNHARKLLAGLNMVVVSWCGGAKAVKKADWSPLVGRHVVIWPDNDDPGIECAQQIAELAVRDALSVQVVEPDPAWPKGHDLADLIAAGWTKPMVRGWIKGHSHLYEPELTPEERLERKADREDARLPPPKPMPDDQPEPPLPVEASPIAGGSPDEPPFALGSEPLPFTMLGHDHGIYYYLGHGAKQVTALAANAHTPGNLYKLAPLSFWSRRWESKRGFDTDQAASDLITAQHARGIYNPKRVRGRGAWWDKATNSAIIHLGDRLIINGQTTGLHDHGTPFVYECADPIAIDLDNPLPKREAVKLEDICGLISWADSINARLLAGWIVCAQVCGALRWKPNIWLLGPKECGKSTVTDHIVKAALGENVLATVGGTTEPALRNLLRADALPIIIDDLDSSSDRGRQANQQILALMRVFSSESGGGLHKGSQTGIAVTYKIHSCYIFSSIVMEADKSADRSRIQILKIVPRKFELGQYDELLAKIRAVLTPEFAPALYARCISQIPMIRHNAEVFAQAVGLMTNSQRTGDVLGHLFAGAWSLRSESAITMDEAKQYVGTRAEVMALIQEQKQELAEDHEGERCLWHLCEQIIMDNNADGRVMRSSVYDLIICAAGTTFDAERARDILKQHGMLVDNEAVYIANEHTQLRNLYRMSAWPTGWGGVLKSIEGVTAYRQMRFSGRQSRASRIPLTMLQRVDKPAQAELEANWSSQ